MCVALWTMGHTNIFLLIIIFSIYFTIFQKNIKILYIIILLHYVYNALLWNIIN